MSKCAKHKPNMMVETCPQCLLAIINENERLKKAGQYLWQSLCDYGSLSTPGSTVFSPDQKFKNKVLAEWEQALRDDSPKPQETK